MRWLAVTLKSDFLASTWEFGVRVKHYVKTREW